MAGGGVNGKAAAQPHHPLAHVGQSLAAVAGGDSGVEAAPIVGNLQFDLLGGRVQPHGQAGGVGVLQGVVERLFGHTEQLVLDAGRDVAVVVGRQLDADAGTLLDRLQPLAQRADAVLAQVGLADRYTFWLRASSYQTRMWYQLDGGPRLDIDSDSDARETIRLNAPSCIDIRFLSWLRVAELDLTSGNHELRIGVEARRNGGQEAHGGIDALCLVNFNWAPTGALKPAMAPRIRAADEWFPLELADDPFSPDSATDLSALIDKPAGAQGRVRSQGDRLLLADGRPLKFWGVNASIPATPELMALKARMLAKHGVNPVSYTHLTLPTSDLV